MTRRVLVTGGSSGIGAAISRRLAADGWTVAVAGRSAERAEAIAAEIGGVAVIGDVADATHDPITDAVAVLGGLDCAVLNAGVIADADLPGTEPDDWHRMLEVNVLAVHRHALAARPHLAATRGSILMTSSDAGVWGETAIAGYSITKRMVLALMRCLAAEWGPDGIRVNALCPGDTAPGMMTTTAGRREPGATESWLPPPLGATVRAHDVAGAAAYLTGDDAARITGVGLLIDAGMRASSTGWQTAPEGSR
jgi:NAD(P)-dependent dehydrogenase (short-subunit alcohol dehydrogenase family)